MSTTVLSTIATPSAPAEAPAEATTTETPETSEPTTEPESTPDSAPVETPSEPEVDPDLEIARKFDSAAKREARARKFEAERQRELQSVTELRKKLAAQIQAFEDDPIAWALENGKDPVELTHKIAKPMTDVEKQLKELRDRERKREEAEAERAAKEQAEAKERERTEIMRQFVRETDPEKHPFLTARYQAHELPGAVQELLRSPNDPSDPDSPTVLEVFKARHNRLPYDNEIRDALEYKSELYARELYERSPLGKKAPPQATPETPPASQGLSNQHAAQVTSGSTRIKSRDEMKQALKEQLEAERR